MISAHLLILYVTALVVVFALPGPDLSLIHI